MLLIERFGIIRKLRVWYVFIELNEMELKYRLDKDSYIRFF